MLDVISITEKFCDKVLFTKIENQNEIDREKTYQNIELAKLISVATTVVFTMIAASNVLALSPIYASFWLGNAYISYECFQIFSSMNERTIYSEGKSAFEIVKSHIGSWIKNAPLCRYVLHAASTPAQSPYLRRKSLSDSPFVARFHHLLNIEKVL